MNKKENFQKKIMTYVALLGLAIVAAVYFLVFQKNMEKAEKIESSNRSLSTRVTQLKTYYDKQNENKKDIAVMEEQIDAMLSQYPADVREENILMVAIDSLEDNEVDYKNITIGGREALKAIPLETVQNAGMEAYQNPIIFAQRKVGLVNSTNYFDLKDIISLINSSADKCTINNIVYSKNENDNCLDGTIEVTYYYALGTGREYEEVDFKKYTAGLDDLFNLKTEEELAEEAAAEESNDEE